MRNFIHLLVCHCTCERYFRRYRHTSITGFARHFSRQFIQWWRIPNNAPSKFTREGNPTNSNIVRLALVDTLCLVVGSTSVRSDWNCSWQWVNCERHLSHRALLMGCRWHGISLRVNTWIGQRRKEIPEMRLSTFCACRSDEDGFTTYILHMRMCSVPTVVYRNENMFSETKNTIMRRFQLTQ